MCQSMALLTLLHMATTISADVGIIGGGFAGLSAAAELQKASISYVILEATSRLGGRVYPIQTADGQWLQMGAEFINGKNNDLYKIAASLGIIDGNDDYEDFFERASYGMGRNKLNYTAVQKFVTFIADMDEEYEEAGNKTPEASVEDYYDQQYTTFMKNNTNNRQTFDALSSVYKNIIQGEWSAPLDTLALANYDTFGYDTNDEDDEEEWMLGGQGFKAILDQLTSRISNRNVRLNTRVTSIDWSGSNVTVTAANSTPFQFDYVIVTLPLGVLKKSTKLFTPSLPGDKLQAIKDSGFGSLQKVLLEYAAPWWNETAKTLITPYTSQNNILGNEMKVFDVLPYRNNTLRLWLSGEGPSESSGMTPKQLGTAVTSHLRTAFSDESIPEPAQVYTYNWNADPLYAGAYSYITPESYRNSEDSFQVLASPLYNSNGQPVVLFAGEHTHSSLYQTTVGAYETGMREAHRILATIRKRKQ